MIDRAAQTRALLDQVSVTLAKYSFKPADEAALQAMVLDVLRPTWSCSSEVIADPRSRLDIAIEHEGLYVVLELKLSGTANAVERQAQRYASLDIVDGVAVVTTSARLVSQLVSPGGFIQKPVDTLAGKPFAVMFLRFM